MKTASISQAKNQLSALIDAVRHGETITITDRDRPVARIVPVHQVEDEDDEARLTRLERAGIIRRPVAPLPKEVLLEPPVKLPPGVSVLEALLEERREGR
jgi:prevent-host-death family protein